MKVGRWYDWPLPVRAPEIERIPETKDKVSISKGSAANPITSNFPLTARPLTTSDIALPLPGGRQDGLRTAQLLQSRARVFDFAVDIEVRTKTLSERGTICSQTGLMVSPRGFRQAGEGDPTSNCDRLK